MKKTLCALAAVAAIGAAASPASAQVARGAPVLAQAGAQDSAIQTVQWRRHGHWHHRHRGYHRRGYGWGPALGGFAAGAIIGGAIASQQAQAAQQQDWIEYCSAKYQSFNPATGTYLAKSGVERPCR